MNYECKFADLDPRDSDLQTLPDAEDASIGNSAMLSTAVCGLGVLILAVYGVFAAVRGLLA